VLYALRPEKEPTEPTSSDEQAGVASLIGRSDLDHTS
jgi:hypothetical protein